MGCAGSREGQLQTNTKTSSSSKGDFQIQMNFRHRETERQRQGGERATRRRHVQINTHKTGDNEDSGRARLDWQTAKEYEHRVLAVLLH